MKGKEERKQTKPQPDELDHIFASAAQSIRKLPRLVQIRFKRDITNMICEAEEQCEWERNQSTPYLSHTTTPTTSPSCTHQLPDNLQLVPDQTLSRNDWVYRIFNN